jgi:hypothetical protein
MKITDDKYLELVFKKLFEEIKKGAKTGVYPIFPPTNINIINNKDVKYETKNGAVNLRECLRQLGVTLYHLTTGESEYNKRESYLIDGYTKPFESKYWPVISHLISGEAYNIPQIEEMMGWKGQTSKNLKSFGKRTITSLSGYTTRISSWCIEKIDREKIRNSMLLRKITLLSFIAMFFAEIGWYWWFNWPLSSGLGMFLLTLIGVCSFSVGLFANNGNNSSNDDWYGPRANFNFTARLLILTIIMILFASTSFLSNFPEDSFGNVTDDSILVSRKTGDFAFRLPTCEDDWLKPLPNLAWNKKYVNHIKYEVVPGIPLKGAVNMKMYVKANNRNIEFPVVIIYSFPAEREIFANEIKKWRNKGHLEEVIFREVENKVFPETVKKIRDSESLFNKNISLLDVFYNNEFVKRERLEISGTVETILNTELKNLKISLPNIILKAEIR